MGIKSFKPITPGRRQMTVATFEEITKVEPERSLIEPLRKTGGRNNNGRITSRWIGGGHKRYYRIIDFKRNKDNVPARVAAIEYDPNRSARIALLHYADGSTGSVVNPFRFNDGHGTGIKACGFHQFSCYQPTGGFFLQPIAGMGVEFDAARAQPSLFVF